MVWVLSIKQKILYICGNFSNSWNFELWSSLRVYLWPLLLMTCLNNLFQSLLETSFYLHSDDLCVFCEDKKIDKTDVLTKQF